VVASNASSIPEGCGDAVAYFDPPDRSAMMAAIDTLLRDDTRRGELIKRGLARARTYSWDRAAERLRAALAEFRFIER
jgi:glycosyltransferase involved in cell wall biosynthesis